MPRKRETLPENYNADFPKRLRELLAENGKSQKELADAMGKTRQAIGYYADGSSSPDWEALKFIANYFEVSADYLLGLSDVKSSEADMQMVCNYTGLSEGAVLALRKAKPQYEALNDLIENSIFVLGSFLELVRVNSKSLETSCNAAEVFFSSSTSERLSKKDSQRMYNSFASAISRLEVSLFRLSNTLISEVNRLYFSEDILREAESLRDNIFLTHINLLLDDAGDTPDGEHKED